jgi:hypothetical protein
MSTDRLIDDLAAGVRPVRPHAVARRLALGLAAGAAGSVLVIVLMLGVRADLWPAMHGFAFWMKWGYTLAIAMLGLVVVARLARPDPGSMRWAWVLAIPVLLLAALGAQELLQAPPGRWLAMWLGGSWRACPWRVLLLAAPIFLGLLWSFRRLAPTRLRAAGAAAGLAAGAFAAMLYCFHCGEVSAIFVLTWYSLGIALAAALGALLGPRLLRW